MIEDDLRGWLATLRPGSRVGCRAGEYGPSGTYVHAGTLMREYDGPRKPGDRIWIVLMDPFELDHVDYDEPKGTLESCPDDWLLPLPSPDTISLAFVSRPRPPRKPRRSPARARKATA
jgi:hypothetical protein